MSVLVIDTTTDQIVYVEQTWQEAALRQDHYQHTTRHPAIIVCVDETGAQISEAA